MPKTSEEMKREEEEVRLLRETLEELKAVRALLAKEYPRSWETDLILRSEVEADSLEG